MRRVHEGQPSPVLKPSVRSMLGISAPATTCGLNITMTDKPTHGELTSAALQAKSAAQADATDNRITRRDAGGRNVAKISEEQWDYVLDRIENGDLEANIARHLGINRSAINQKRARDADFDKRYMRAIENAYINLAHDIQAVTRGVEGYSSGDVRRDELIAKYDLELAKRFANRIIGDKVQVDQRNITVIVDSRPDRNW